MSDIKRLLDIIEENSSDDPIELHDSFDIELDNGYLIETGVVGFTNDGIIIEGDDITCNLLGLGGVLLEDVDQEEYDDEAGMSDNNLETLRRAVDGIDELIQPGENLPEWCQEKIAVAKSMLVSVWDYMKSAENSEDGSPVDEAKEGLWANIHAKRKRIKSGSGERMRKPGSEGAPTADALKKSATEGEIAEAEYQGRKVALGKPMQGDVKKSKVYVRKPNGKIVKVNFGDKTMRIKKSNPGRRKNFRARHNCDNPGPRWKARYWSCRAW